MNTEIERNGDLDKIQFTLESLNLIIAAREIAQLENEKTLNPSHIIVAILNSSQGIFEPLFRILEVDRQKLSERKFPLLLSFVLWVLNMMWRVVLSIISKRRGFWKMLCSFSHWPMHPLLSDWLHLEQP